MKLCNTVCISYGKNGIAWWNENVRKLVKERKKVWKAETESGRKL